MNTQSIAHEKNKSYHINFQYLQRDKARFSTQAINALKVCAWIATHQVTTGKPANLSSICEKTGLETNTVLCLLSSSSRLVSASIVKANENGFTIQNTSVTFRHVLNIIEPVENCYHNQPSLGGVSW